MSDSTEPNADVREPSPKPPEAGNTERVVAVFDDRDEAAEAAAALEAQDAVADVDANTAEDTDLAFASTVDRGDSAERPPDITVAAKVDEEAADVVADQVADDADRVETGR